jgi:hypothetical protein
MVKNEYLVCPNTGSCCVYASVYRGRTDMPATTIQYKEGAYSCHALDRFKVIAERSDENSSRNKTVSIEDYLKSTGCVNLKLLNDGVKQ